MSALTMARGPRVRRHLGALSLVVVALTVAGCAGAPSEGAMPDGDPVRIASMLPLGQAAGDFAVAQAGLDAAVRGINSRGGVQGRPVVLDTCNTLLDPNQEAACARKAVDDGSVAVIAPFNVVNPEIPAIFEEGQVASINPPQQYPEDFVTPTNFVMTADAFAHAGCGGLVSESTGERRVAALTLDLPGAEFAGVMAGQAAVAAGGEYVGAVPVSLNVADMAPVVQRLADLDPEVVYIATQPETIPQLLSTARAQGHDWTYCFGQIVQQSILAPLGDLADSFYSVASLPPIALNADNPLVVRFREEMKAEEDAGNPRASTDPSNDPDQAFGGWLSVQLFAQVAEGISGPIDHTTFLAAMGTATANFDGVLPPIDFSTTNPDPAYARVVNDTMLLLRWDPDSRSYEFADGVERTSAAELLY